MKKKTGIIGTAIVLTGSRAYGCVTCNPQLQESIFDSTFYPNLLTMLAAFIVLAVIIVLLTWMATKRDHMVTVKTPNAPRLTAIPLTAAATVAGIGIGGFIDGIVLHQILQWHEMLSHKIPPDTLLRKSVNMFWDGIFHLFTLVTSIVGIYLLWKLLHRKNINRSGYLLAGGISMGWGLFNLVEGIIDHHLLKLHNVRELNADHDLWNYGFLAFSLLLLLAGWLWMKKGERAAYVA